MGRITIFSADGCPHCRRTQAALRAKNLPFVKISITQYPEKRDDMIALSHRISTPQVFFNTRHVGGAKETMALLEEWETDQSRGYRNARERYADEIERFADPTNERFAVPTGEPVKVDAGPPRGREEYSIVLPWSKEKTTVLEMTELLKRVLPSQSIHRRMTLHHLCFTLEEAIRALENQYAGISSDDAVQFFHHLIQQELIVPVESNFTSSTPSLQQQANVLYRLQCHAEPLTLNTYRVWKEDLQGVTPAQLLYHLCNLMSQIQHAISNDEGQIDYTAGKHHPLYPIFEEATCALQKVELKQMNDKEKKAFGINLYNLMIKYAFIKVGAGDSDYNRLIFFNRVSFRVGPHTYNFQDWENGFLRGNRKAPYAMSLQFSAKKQDPRLELMVQDVDERLHFALNCGAQSCPPVNYYTAENLNQELKMAAAAFCEDEGNVTIIDDDNDKRELKISKIFSWYKSDFVENAKQYPTQVLTYLMSLKKQKLQRVMDSAQREMQQVKVSFLPYDWSTGALHIETFNVNVWKVQERRGPLQKMMASTSSPSPTKNRKTIQMRKTSMPTAELASP